MNHEPPSLGHSPAIDRIQSEMEGQALYELYVQRLSQQTSANLQALLPGKWKDLSQEHKDFWCELAMDFLKVAS